MEISLIVLAVSLVLAAYLLSRRRVTRPDDVQTGAELETLRAMRLGLDDARSSIVAISATIAERKSLEEKALTSVQGIERMMAGPWSRGRSGENLLAAALAEFPPDMVKRDFRIGGRVCEFGFRMLDGRILPVDSKWPGPELVAELEDSSDPAKREELRKRIEKLVCSRIKEVAGYVDPSVTVPLAVLAVPDPVYSCCRSVHVAAKTSRVNIVSYSLAVPFLLSLWMLHDAYSRDIDHEMLIAGVNQIGESIRLMEGRLEGQLSKGLKMAENAALEMRSLLADARASLTSVSRSAEVDDAVV